MDREKALLLMQELRSKPVKNWIVERFINNGKSAAVFEAVKGSQRGALKVFDKDLIERFGDETQISRIERELELIGHDHPSMVQIIDGGVDREAGQFFIVMEYLDGPNIKECLENIPLDRISSLISQLASAALFLESRGLAHRDIKPENIVLLNDFATLKLLDFGVIRPIGQPGLTDDEGIQNFVGTLQYSSPEFLLRKEKDTMEGWRALTFYQIGGVLHDLIMRRSLFQEFAIPYPRLVNAVQNSIPKIQNSAVSPTLIDLAKCCLLKDPAKRLQLVSWDSFRLKQDDTGSSAKQRVTNKAAIRAAEKIDEDELPRANPGQVVELVTRLITHSSLQIERESEFFPEIEFCAKVKNQSAVHMKLNFKGSEAFGFVVCVHIDPLDTEIDAVSLCTSVHKDTSTFYANDESDRFFNGPVDGAAIHQALEDGLFRRVEAALTQADER